MSNKRELKAELQMGLADLTEYLEAIVSGLRDGKVYLEHGNEVVGLTPAQTVSVEIEAKQKKDKERLCLEISWRRAEGDEWNESELKISSQKGEAS